MENREKRIRGLGEMCPGCKRQNALAVWSGSFIDSWLECDYCDYSELQSNVRAAQ